MSVFIPVEKWEAVYDLSGKRREIMILYQQYQNSLSGNPGETIEFDWGDVKLEINGKIRIFSMGLLTTAKGFYHDGKLYQNKKMENFLDIHGGLVSMSKQILTNYRLFYNIFCNKKTYAKTKLA